MGASSPTTTGFRPRLTQDEKTAETRRRLLDAAIGCLVERGYANTTTSEIAERAGLSRGAQLYHFPRKEDLLTSAVEHMCELMYREIKERAGRLTNVDDRRAVAIDLLWETCRGRLMTAWTEIIVASRTDAYLREAVSAATARSGELIGRSFRELFPPPEGSPDYYDLIPQAVIMLLSGMAVQEQILDSELETKVLTLLKTFKL